MGNGAVEMSPVTEQQTDVAKYLRSLLAVTNTNISWLASQGRGEGGEDCEAVLPCILKC
jgi:hypothetical protein